MGPPPVRSHRDVPAATAMHAASSAPVIKRVRTVGTMTAGPGTTDRAAVEVTTVSPPSTCLRCSAQLRVPSAVSSPDLAWCTGCGCSQQIALNVSPSSAYGSKRELSSQDDRCVHPDELDDQCSAEAALQQQQLELQYLHTSKQQSSERSVKRARAAAAESEVESAATLTQDLAEVSLTIDQLSSMCRFLNRVSLQRPEPVSLTVLCFRMDRKHCLSV